MILDAEKFEQRGKYWYRKGQRSTHAYEVSNCKNPECDEPCLVSRADHRPGKRGFCSHSCASKALAEQTTGHLRGKTGSAAQGWKGDAVGYASAHDRVEAVRGLASLHACVDCGDTAHDWSYDHTDPAQRLDAKGHPFSLDTTHYDPRCTPCHNKFDVAFRLIGAPPCGICGRPTRSVLGVCQGPLECRRERNRRWRANDAGSAAGHANDLQSIVAELEAPDA
jgi:hypothetical protein